MSERLDVRAVRRLALCRAGLLKPAWSGLAERAQGSGVRARAAVQALIERFGYLQLDTVSIAGARSHALVLLSRLEGLDPGLAEELLHPGCSLFEYWGHEASWMPMELYPAFAFRRREFASHPWWGDLLEAHPKAAQRLRDQLREQGPLRSVDLEGSSGAGWWDLKLAARLATAMWSSGELAILERRNFQRSYDFAENVIPIAYRESSLSEEEALAKLLLCALDGHGWATTGTLKATWRLARRGHQLRGILEALVESGELLPCELHSPQGNQAGWIRPADLELAARLERVRPVQERGVLLSPFDPLLWDRARVARLFGFEQLLEIFKPKAQRRFGYFCLPVLAGERLVARFDLKAHKPSGRLQVLSCRFEAGGGASANSAVDHEAARSALERHAQALELEPTGWPARRRKS